MKNSLVALTIIIVILVSGVAGYVAGTGQTATQYSINTSFLTQTATRTLTKTVTSSAIACTTTYPNGVSLNGQIQFANASSSIFLCVKYYYYNSTGTFDLNLRNGQQLGFYAMVTQNTIVSAASNFTVIASPSTIVIGGPNNENEGATVIYDIALNGVASGSYILTIGTLASTLENCASEYKLVIGSGTPNYYVGGSCTAPLSSQYPTNSEGLVNGFVFAEIIGTAS